MEHVMRFSQAIREGAQLGPQAFGAFGRQRRRYFFGLIGPVVNESCALGAAIAAGSVGSREEIKADEGSASRSFRGEPARVGEKVRIIEWPDEWNMLLWTNRTCPQCGYYDVLFRVIPHLNDEHRWTREAIACFVETVERERQGAPSVVEIGTAEHEIAADSAGDL